MAVVNELVTKFTFVGTLKPLENFQSGLRTGIIGIGKMALGFGVLTAATAAWANSTLRGAESLVRLSDDTNIAIETLQKMRLVTAQNGVSNGTFESSIISLTDKIGEAATQGSEDFNRLGISVRDAEGNIKSTDVVLAELTNKFRDLSQEQQISFSKKLGIDNKVIDAFKKSDKELKRLSDQASKFGLVTEKQTKQLKSYFASIETLRFGFTAVSRQMALNFAPVMERVSNNVTDFLADFGTTFGPVLAEFVDGIGNLIGAADDLITSTIGWKPILVAFGAAMAIAFPVILIVGAVATILIAIEDLITAFKGGKSVIADFFKDAFDFDIVKAFTAEFKILSDMVDLLTEDFKELVKWWSDAFDIAKAFYGGDSNLNITPLPASAVADNAVTQSMTNDIKIEVRSNDPEAAGIAVSNALNRELEQVSFQYGKGGR